MYKTVSRERSWTRSSSRYLSSILIAPGLKTEVTAGKSLRVTIGLAEHRRSIITKLG
jgi:hypothetical protein